MTTSVINTPPKSHFIKVSDWALKACEGNACAAALLHHLIYWHDVRVANSIKAKHANKVAKNHGGIPTQDESYYLFFTTEQLEEAVMCICRKSKIKESLDLLVSKGFISIHDNPNPRFKFDKTRHFLLHPNVINTWIKENYDLEKETDSDSRQSEKGSPSAKNSSRSDEINGRHTEKGRAIQENTNKKTKEENFQQQEDELVSLVKELEGYGINLHKARNLASHNPQTCRKQLDWFPYRRSQQSFKSPVGALITSIESDWPMPPEIQRSLTKVHSEVAAFARMRSASEASGEQIATTFVDLYAQEAYQVLDELTSWLHKIGYHFSDYYQRLKERETVEDWVSQMQSDGPDEGFMIDDDSELEEDPFADVEQ